MKALRYTFAALLILLCIWFLLPLLGGVTHIGMFYPVVLLLPLIVVLLRPSLLKGGQKKKIILSVVGIGYFLGFIACGVTMGVMIQAKESTPPDNTTVIVLGCRVYGSNPSRMLSDRCEAAYDYLTENPEAYCIATGGLGHNADISEAESIFNILTEKGIEPHRIYLEEQATDTEENLAFSAKLMEENGLPPVCVIATDGFHQYRADLYAEQAGLTAYAIPSETYLFVLPGYWAREILAIWKAFLFH